MRTDPVLIVLKKIPLSDKGWWQYWIDEDKNVEKPTYIVHLQANIEGHYIRQSTLQKLIITRG